MNYSILIPVHNEEKSIPILLSELEYFSKKNEIIIIDDGSTDSSRDILLNCSFIKLIILSKNSGKGLAIRAGLSKASNNKIIITDGDLELDTKEIIKFMILDRKHNVNCVIGSRYLSINQFDSLWNFGNFIFVCLFNLIHKKNLKDVLCCSKAFFKNDIDLDSLYSNKFDIDIELTSKLIKKFKYLKVINLKYNRRHKIHGKKLRLSDAALIFYRMIYLSYRK
jgi:glycosyltransferase involved in cell wall biosynthesis